MKYIMSSKTKSCQIQKAVEKAEWEKLFDFFDQNKNGTISIVEFITTMDDLRELECFDDWQNVLKSFRNADDGDRKLTKAEFAKMMGVKFNEIKVITISQQGPPNSELTCSHCSVKLSEQLTVQTVRIGTKLFGGVC